MIKIKQTIIVEGKYDKIKLDSFIDALIIPTNGFSIFKDAEKRELICKLAKENGIIIITDSDSAGMMIRNHIKGFVKEGSITNVFIPDILGKEKRKLTPSKEGKLGVEGIPVDVIKECLTNAGVDLENSDVITQTTWQIKKSDLYEDGFLGCDNSSQKRQMLLERLGLPHRISTNDLVEILGRICTKEQYEELKNDINTDFISK